MKRVRFTKAGLEKFKKEYEDLIRSRPDAVMHLKKSRELGDLSENGYYKASRAKLNFIDNRLFRIKMIIKQAEVIEENNTGKAGIGSKIVLVDGGKEFRYRIVGDMEANPREGKISLLSPLGQALEGRKAGDKVEFNSPAGLKVFEIKLIS